MAAPDIAAACFGDEPADARLRRPAPARPPRRRHAHLGQLLPHRCRLLRLSAVGLFRPLARSGFRADAGLGRRLGSRDDRAAFLAEGAPLVRAPAIGGPVGAVLVPVLSLSAPSKRVGRLPLWRPTRTGSTNG